MSLSQNLGQQETGVTKAGTSSFSRATRDHYDEGAWAMTLFNSSAHEIIISPDPAERKRRENEPAFIRPSQEGTYLGGLITILHSIPLAREALLLRNRFLPNYGHDSQWWNGQPINLPKIVTMLDAQEGDTDWDDIIYETQRLVAFLDTTIRAFGSSDALANLQCVSQYDRDNAVSRFLEAWQEAAVRADPGNQLGTIFSTTGYKGSLPAEDMDQTEFLLLEPLVEHDPGQTLYNVLDRALWCDRPDQPLEDAWLETVAEVLVMKLESTQKPIDVVIPSVFYADRYMANSREVAREFRTRRLQAYEEMDMLDKAIKRCSQSKLTAQTGMSSRDVLETAASAITSKFAISAPGDINTEYVAKELKTVSAKIEKHLRGLEDKRRRIKEGLREYSKILTEASPDAEPHYKYTLRGVCTQPHVTYVLRRCDEHGSDDEPSITGEYQWWRFSFSTEDAAIRKAESEGRAKTDFDHADIIGYTARKVNEAEVLQAAREESNQVLLVYANSNAVSMGVEPAPAQLQKFVEKDNKTFESELQDAEMAQQQSETQHQSSGTLVGLSLKQKSRLHIADANWQPSLKPEQERTTQNVNVFDYQVPSFNETQEPGQEMQQRNGRPLLSRSSTTGPVQPPPSDVDISRPPSRITNCSQSFMAPENDTVAGATIELLETRLRRLTFLLTGDANWTGEPTPPTKPASLDDSISRRLLRLEKDLERLSRNNSAVRDVLRLHDRFPELFHPAPPGSLPENLTTQNLASVVLSYASAFPETASRLTSLNDLPIPDAETSASLIQLQPRLDQLSKTQEDQARQISELRVRSAKALQRWYEVALVSGGECWAEWEGRLEDVEREVRREEVVRERREKEL
ncbi:putative nuclear distribution protein RO10 [Aspergillus saccharolyticus JOP 1030-1]|uniref:Ubiquitin interaction motif protein n=1 Tax=Aspergillus saccharolyticus JOP 1030-1 TaxID=1450539 RepID=A0A318ZDS3_9EURO|nr:hypothetical protein BP01DRAFT_376859 [Aspergillus saccharolyticus JOP 1030-1]PYH41680.1 hypothetical protein BP01DRAFT_376859 [Aspergillus saccharolyticus JOP 1030-1]